MTGAFAAFSNVTALAMDSALGARHGRRREARHVERGQRLFELLSCISASRFTYTGPCGTRAPENSRASATARAAPARPAGRPIWYRAAPAP